MKKTTLLFTLIILMQMIHAQEKILLYPTGPAESNDITEPEQFLRKDFMVKISEPRMYAYPAPKENNSGTAVLICPGGGYSGVSVIKEGEEIALWYNKIGVSAFVLYYRMPNFHHEIPLKDAQAAMEIIYKRAKEWGIDRKKIGIMGFSAGGHLASTAGTHFTGKINRPAFMVLAYPVISMQVDVTHKGSKNNLLGKTPDEKLVQLYSNELQVNKKTPPAFIFHAMDDKTVPVLNSQLFADALKKNKVPVELYTFPEGGHGIGMRPTNPEADKWPAMLENWMRFMKLIK
ncbi:MAG: alpha/beta hydrolase [Paludibacter sp.]|nr:alpha/beta hydrolase [Paludibacter sp.]